MDEPADEPQAPDDESVIDRLIGPYVRESTLWPVALVLLAHLAMGMSLAILSAVRSPAGFGTLSLAILIVVTGSAVTGDLRRRRLGLSSGLLLAVWVLGALLAWIADRSGIY